MLFNLFSICPSLLMFSSSLLSFSSLYRDWSSGENLIIFELVTPSLLSFIFQHYESVYCVLVVEDTLISIECGKC